MKSLLILLSVPIALLAVGCNDNEAGKTVKPDNTKVNERDAEGNTATPFEQSNDQADIDLVAKIRKQVVDADDMSVKGQNVKIITNGGKVILRGPVESAAEKDAIGEIAADAAGAANVTNNLEVDND